MKIAGAWLAHPGTQSLMQALTGAGAQAFFVGGCVRNAIIGAPVADIDIATDALPDLVMRLCAASGYRVVPTGVDHGTVTVIAEGIAHEITTFRRDIATDGRHATVAFSTDITQDAQRRDFTMNALYADAAGAVIDPLGGLPDLLARRVVFVGSAEARITEDYLRILRFFRFHAWYGDPAQGLDPKALAACAAQAEGLSRVSRERIGHEMRKLLAAPDPAPALAAMQQSGVLMRVLPGADAQTMPVLVHLENDASPRWQRRLLVLGGHDAADALRLSRDEARDITAARKHLSDRPAHVAQLLGADTARDCALAFAALTTQPLPDDLDHQIMLGANARFPLTAADLMPALQGPALGAALKAARARWIASDFSLTREALLRG